MKKSVFISPFVDRGLEQLESLQFKVQKALFQRLEELARIVNMNKKERDEYEACLKVYRDNYNTWNYMKEQALKEGLEEGLAKGLEEGIAKGIEQGIEQGIEIGVNKGKKENSYDIARKMKQKGLSVDMIAECTGLSKSEIEKLM